jgi:hypothetical protein
MTTCIVNVAIGAWHPRGQERLAASLDAVGFNGHRLFYRDTLPSGSPSHTDIPYAFKPHAVAEARRLGFEQVLWVDAAVWAIKDLSPVWAHIDQHGYLFFLNGFTTGQWCADAALGPLGITREESFSYPHMMACVMGFDFRNERTNRFLDEWIARANDGVTFVGAWRNDQQQVSSDTRVLGHRHDQTAASVIAHRMGMQNWLPSQDTFLLYYTDGATPKESVCLLSQGM